MGELGEIALRYRDAEGLWDVRKKRFIAESESNGRSRRISVIFKEAVWKMFREDH